MAQDMQDAGNVSAELDAMVCDLIGAFLDVLPWSTWADGYDAHPRRCR